jgi:hypothetical protein
MKSPFRFLALILACAASASAADLTSIGDWTESIDASNLASGAGSDIQGPLQSMTGVTVLSIANSAGRWRLKAHVAPNQWNPNLVVWVQRVTDGTGRGCISSGASYVQLGSTDVELFRGVGDRSNISIRFKLSGLTHRISPASYSSSVVFSVQ